MSKLLGLILVGGILWLASSESTREQAEDLVRDLSESMLALTLRFTSGFAHDVPDPVLREEHERRLRWR